MEFKIIIDQMEDDDGGEQVEGEKMKIDVFSSIWSHMLYLGEFNISSVRKYFLLPLGSTQTAPFINRLLDFFSSFVPFLSSLHREMTLPWWKKLILRYRRNTDFSSFLVLRLFFSWSPCDESIREREERKRGVSWTITAFFCSSHRLPI